MAAAEQPFHVWKGRNPYLRADFQYTTRQTALLPEQDANNALNDVTLPGLPVTANRSCERDCWNGYDISSFATKMSSTNTRCCSRPATSPTIKPTTPELGQRPPPHLGVTATYRY